MSALALQLAWNSAVAVGLAAGILLAGRVCKRPELLHALWILVLAKLVAPGLVGVAVLPAPEPVAAIPVADVVATVPAAPLPAPSSRVPWAAVLWACGSVSLAALAIVRWRAFARTIAGASAPGPELATRLERLAALAGVRVPRTVVVDRRIPPAVWRGRAGMTLAIPAGLFERFDHEEADAILLHELAHIRRGDPWVRWFELAVATVLWWNPLVWWVRRRLRAAEEQACDRKVLELSPGAERAYARGIVKTVEFLAGSGNAPAFATGVTGARLIHERLTMILDPRRPRRLRRPLIPALLLAAVALPLAPGFAQRDDAEERPNRESFDRMQALEQEALDLERRLLEVRREQERLHARLAETHSHRAAVKLESHLAEARREGDREAEIAIRAELEALARGRDAERSQREEIAAREYEIRLAQSEMREQALALERARHEDDADAVAAHERAFALQKREIHERAEEMERAKAFYEQALAEVELREAKKRREAAGLGRDDAEMRVRELELMQDKLRFELMRLREQADGVDGFERERLAGRIDRISAELEKIRRALAEAAR